MQKKMCGSFTARSVAAVQAVGVLFVIASRHMLVSCLSSTATLLVDQPWPMPRACFAGGDGSPSPAHIIATHQQRAVAAQAAILARPAGGFGNEVDTVIHGFLRALVTGKRLLVAETPVMRYFAETPLWSLVDATGERVVRLASNDLHAPNLLPASLSVEHMPVEPWLPFSPHDHGLWRRLWGNLTHNASALVSCASHALFQPNRSVAASIAPYLRELERSRNGIGVHMRSSDKEMAERQGVDHRRQLRLQLRGVRQGCTAGDALIGKVARCAEHATSTATAASSSAAHDDSGWPSAERLTYFYIATDSSARLAALRSALAVRVPTARVITSAGEPYHTGRPIDRSKVPTTDGADPIAKALVDFFVLSRIGRFFSNCDFLTCVNGSHASLWGAPSDAEDLIVSGRHEGEGEAQRNPRCGHSFAGNIWIRRAVHDARSPDLDACPY